MYLEHVTVRRTCREQWRAEQAGCETDDLGHGERVALAQLRHPRRREEWLAGRSLAKRLVAETLEGCGVSAAPSEIEIVSRDGDNRGARPQILLRGAPLRWSLSIAHSDQLLAATLSVARSVGVDTVPVEPRTARFQSLWFTERERDPCGGILDPFQASTVWALKEAVYKAVNQGEPFIPRAIEIIPRGADYASCLRGRELPIELHVAEVAGNVLALAVAGEVFKPVPRDAPLFSQRIAPALAEARS